MTDLGEWLNIQLKDFYEDKLPPSCKKEFIEFLKQYRHILMNDKSSSPMVKLLTKMCYKKLDTMINKK
jgi:hypothetical protein